MFRTVGSCAFIFILCSCHDYWPYMDKLTKCILFFITLEGLKLVGSHRSKLNILEFWFLPAETLSFPHLDSVSATIFSCNHSTLTATSVITLPSNLLCPPLLRTLWLYICPTQMMQHNLHMSACLVQSQLQSILAHKVTQFLRSICGPLSSTKLQHD